MLVLVFMAAAMAALAQPPPVPASAPVTLTTKTQTTENQPAVKKAQVVTVFHKPFKTTPQLQSDKIVRVDGMSSQPWYRMAGQHPGWSAFPDPEHQDPSFNVFWIGTPEH
jgi:hypothetical protein